MTDQPELLPTRPIEAELANQFKIAFDLGAKNLALQETVARLTKERDALLINARKLSQVFLMMGCCDECGVVFADGKSVAICAKHAPLIGEINAQRRAAIALCKEST